MASAPHRVIPDFITIPVSRFVPHGVAAAGGNNGQGALGHAAVAVTSVGNGGGTVTAGSGGNTLIVGAGVGAAGAGNGAGTVNAGNNGGMATTGNGGGMASGDDDNDDNDDDSGNESEDESDNGDGATDKPFRFMDMPTEVRLDVYRICLKRNRHIILRNKKLPTKTVYIRHNQDVTTTKPHAARVFQAAAPLTPIILRVSKKIYEEARAVLYGENKFHLDVFGSIDTLARLHQRSRRLITSVEIEIPTTDIAVIDRFMKVVRLSLRYFSGLKKLVVYLPVQDPKILATHGNALQTTLGTANIWESMRWLPEDCVVYLEGESDPELEWTLQKYVKLGNPQYVRYLANGDAVRFKYTLSVSR